MAKIMPSVDEKWESRQAQKAPIARSNRLRNAASFLLSPARKFLIEISGCRRVQNTFHFGTWHLGITLKTSLVQYLRTDCQTAAGIRQSYSTRRVSNFSRTSAGRDIPIGHSGGT